MRNYYDDLEISKTASKEVIERVYKVLAKKYHPDTTQETDKKAAEEKFKIISEAYEVLSNDEKRKKYDLELEQSNPSISYEDYINVVNQRDSLNNSFNNLKNEFNNFKTSNNANQQYYNRNAQSQYNPNQYNQNQYNGPQYNPNQYNQPNFNNGFNNYQNPNMNQNNPNLNNNSKGKKYYYNTVTGQRVSSFTYFKYKMREFFQNIVFYILLFILFVFIIQSIISTGLNGLLN